MSSLARTSALMRKELASYFAGPLVYVVIGAFLCVTGLQFYTTLNSFVTIGFGLNILEHFWEEFFNNSIAFYLLIVVPLFTMRLLAEERRLGTIELLYTYPLRDREIMLGKFLACLLVFLLFVACTLLYGGVAICLSGIVPWNSIMGDGAPVVNALKRLSLQPGGSSLRTSAMFFSSSPTTVAGCTPGTMAA